MHPTVDTDDLARLPDVDQFAVLAGMDDDELAGVIDATAEADAFDSGIGDLAGRRVTRRRLRGKAAALLTARKSNGMGCAGACGLAGPCSHLPAGPQRRACRDARLARRGNNPPPPPANNNAGEIAALNQESAARQQRINALLATRPDLRPLAPANLMRPGPGETPPNTIHAKRALAARLRQLETVLMSLRSRPVPGNQLPAGDTFTLNAGPDTPDRLRTRLALQVARNAAVRSRLAMQRARNVELVAAQQQPATSPQQPAPAPTPAVIDARVQQLDPFAAWDDPHYYERVPDANDGWEAPIDNSSDIDVGEGYSYAGGNFYGDGVALEPDPAEVDGYDAEDVGYEFDDGASYYESGMGSWLSKSFKKVTGSSLTSALPAIGGIVGSIVPGVGTVIGGAIGSVVAGITAKPGEAPPPGYAVQGGPALAVANPPAPPPPAPKPARPFRITPAMMIAGAALGMMLMKSKR